jgi:ferredoxin-NADP reductase
MEPPIPIQAPAHVHPAPARPHPPLQEAEVLGVRAISDRALALRVARPPGFDFPSTQVAQLALGEERRTFTIASAPSQPWLEFATLRGASPFKQAFAALKQGDRVGLRGPGGRFHLDASQPALMLAGHIGIAPFHAFLEDAVAKGLPLRGALLHAHPADDAPYAREVAALAAQLPGLRVEHVAPGALADPLRLAPLVGPDTIVYLAGSPSEVAGAAAGLEPFALPRERVRVELFHGYR